MIFVPHRAPELWFPDRLILPSAWAGHIPFAFWLVDKLQPQLIIELGLGSGNAYFAFCQAVHKLRYGAACFAIDPPPPDGDPAADPLAAPIVEAREQLDRYHQIHYSPFSQRLCSSFEAAVHKFGDRTIDLLHLHHPATPVAMQDNFATWLPKLSERAIVLVSNLNQSASDGDIGSVWADLAARYPHFTFTHAQGLGVLAVGSTYPEPIQELLAASQTPARAESVRLYFERLGRGLAQRSEHAQVRQEYADLKQAWSVTQQEQQHYQDTIQQQTVAIAQQHQQLAEYQAQAETIAAATHHLETQITTLQAQLEDAQATAQVDSPHRQLASDLQVLTEQWQALQQSQTQVATAQQSLGQVQRDLQRQLAQVQYQLQLQPSTAGKLSRLRRAIRQRVRPLMRSPLALPVAFIRLAASWNRQRWRTDRQRQAAWPLLQASPLFDADYYRSQRPDLAIAAIDPIDHFLQSGVAEGLQPHPLFDPQFYLATYPDVAIAAVNPLVHYLMHGGVEGRCPHPLFDVAYYQAQLSSPLAETLTPLEHYLTIADGQRCSPHPLFDVAYYRQSYPAVSSSPLPPLVHYLTEGATLDYNPNPLFDTAWYRETYGAHLPKRQNPLAHYVQHGASRGYQPSVKFDGSWYQRQYPDVAQCQVNPLVHFLQQGAAEQRYPHPDLGQDYDTWWQRYGVFDAARRHRLEQQQAQFTDQPQIGLGMVIGAIALPDVQATLASLQAQLYPHWQLRLVVLPETPDTVWYWLKDYQQQEPRLTVERTSVQAAIAVPIQPLADTTADWVASLSPMAELAPTALFRLVQALQHQPDARLFYTDEDQIAPWGTHRQPNFKCDLNYELMLTHNALGQWCVYARELWQQLTADAVIPTEPTTASVASASSPWTQSILAHLDLNRLDAAQIAALLTAAWHYDLNLRAIEVLPRDQIVHLPYALHHTRQATLAATANAQPPHILLDSMTLAQALKVVVEAHLQRRDRAATVTLAPAAPGYLRVQFAVPTPPPLVSMVIPTRDRVDLVKQCVDSIRAKSTYPAIELVIVDNGSVEPASHAYFDHLAQTGARIVRDESPFNFSALINLGVQTATGELICLLNNDVEVQTPDWLEELVGIGCQPDVGCVGARLWYPHGRLQHGGILVGNSGIAHHAFIDLPRGEPGYQYRAVLMQQYRAVTAACLLVRRHVFAAVDGFDPNLPVLYNDVDFCLRVQAAGYRNVWTPYAELIHYESASRGEDETSQQQQRFQQEIGYMFKRWGTALRTDPTYNPNLTRLSPTFALGFPQHDWNGMGSP